MKVHTAASSSKRIMHLRIVFQPNELDAEFRNSIFLLFSSITVKWRLHTSHSISSADWHIPHTRFEIKPVHDQRIHTYIFRTYLLSTALTVVGGFISFIFPSFPFLCGLWKRPCWRSNTLNSEILLLPNPGFRQSNLALKWRAYSTPALARIRFESSLRLRSYIIVITFLLHGVHTR